MSENSIDSIRFYTNRSLNHCIELRKEVINFYDLTFLLDGKITYNINGEDFTIYKNDVIIIPPGSTRFRYASDSFVTYASFNFWVSDDSIIPKQTILKDSITNNIYKLLSIFPVEYRHSSIRAENYIQPSLYSHEKLKSILNLILLELKDVTQHKSNNRHILNIIQYIESHVYEQLTLDTISKKFNLSKEYISYLFKKETDKNISNYINESKMNQAIQMMSYSDMSLIEISEALGYSNYNYFSRCFKNTFTHSPKKMQLTFKKHKKQF